MFLRPQDISRRGLKPEYTALEDTELVVPNNGSVVLHVIYQPAPPKKGEKEEGGVVVTIFPDPKYLGDQYGSAQDLVAPGPDGVFIGPFPHEAYTNDSSDCFTAVFSTTEGVRVSALRVSRT